MDAEYTWFGAIKFKCQQLHSLPFYVEYKWLVTVEIKCHESTVYPWRSIFAIFCPEPEHPWLGWSEIRCQEGTAQSVIDIEHTLLGAAKIKWQEGTVYHWQWIYMLRCSRNQMPGRHSLSLTWNIHGSVQQKSKSRRVQSQYRWRSLHMACLQLTSKPGRLPQSVIEVEHKWLVARGSKRWLYMARYSRNQMPGRHSLSLNWIFIAKCSSVLHFRMGGVWWTYFVKMQVGLRANVMSIAHVPWVRLGTGRKQILQLGLLELTDGSMEIH